jgi:anti-sigma-K factor RskA
MKAYKKHVKRLILTDYLDNRLEEKQKHEMDRIIAEDEELRGFLREARNKTVSPFSAAPVFHAPERIWVGVEGRLAELPPLANSRFWPGWLFDLPQSRWVWAEFGFALVLILAMTFVRTGRQSFARYDKDSQIEYLMFLTQGQAGAGVGESKTNIEKFFL